MARLQSLKYLHIKISRDLYWPPPGPAYAAFTASSSLESLVVCAGVPGGVWLHVFPATHKLPHLTHMCTGDEWGPHSAWDAADMSSLVNCCPNLCELSNTHLSYGFHVSELHKLAALTRLDVTLDSGDTSRYRESVRGMAAVTQLQDLRFELSSTLHEVGCLLPLASLTALTTLRCCWKPGPNKPFAESGFVHTQEVSN